MTRGIRENFIVTADDYGIRETAEPILRLARAGKVDRVAVLIRYVSSEQVAALQATGVKIDLHLEMIRLLKSGEKITENSFKRGLNFFVRFAFGRLPTKSVAAAWRSQIEAFRESFGRLPDGLNSHEHLHYFPPFFRVYRGLAEEYHIPYVRFGRRGMLTGRHHSLIGWILAFFWKRTRKDYAKTDLATSDYLVSLDWLSDFKSFSAQVPDGSIELVVHLEREEEYRIVQEHFSSFRP